MYENVTVCFNGKPDSRGNLSLLLQHLTMVPGVIAETNTNGTRLNGQSNGTHSSSHSGTNTGNEIQTPVLIVGGGPSGLLAAYLLSTLGSMCSSIYKSSTIS